MFKREGGRAVKKRRKSILMPRLLCFTFCFLLFVAQLAPSLPFSLAARLFPTLRLDRQLRQYSSDETAQTKQLRLDERDHTAQARQLRLD